MVKLININLWSEFRKRLALLKSMGKKIELIINSIAVNHTWHKVKIYFHNSYFNHGSSMCWLKSLFFNFTLLRADCSLLIYLAGILSIMFWQNFYIFKSSSDILLHVLYIFTFKIALERYLSLNFFQFL